MIFSFCACDDNKKTTGKKERQKEFASHWKDNRAAIE